MQYKCEMLDLLMNTPNVEVMWVKKVEYNEKVNMEFCDYMICSSSATNLGTDVLRTVANATLVHEEKTNNGYDVAVYKNVSSKTTVTQVRQYSTTLVIGIKCYVENVERFNVSPMSISQQNSYSYSGGNYGVSAIAVENKGWKILTAKNHSNVQYASVFNIDTEERIMLNVTNTDSVDISNVKNIRLMVQSITGTGLTSGVTWTLE